MWESYHHLNEIGSAATAVQLVPYSGRVRLNALENSVTTSVQYTELCCRLILRVLFPPSLLSALPAGVHGTWGAVQLPHVGAVMCEANKRRGEGMVLIRLSFSAEQLQDIYTVLVYICGNGVLGGMW